MESKRRKELGEGVFAPSLDDVDRAIIRELQRNGRASNTEIGRAIGVTETTVRKRIGRLIEDDLVNVVAVPTPRAVGLTQSAIIGISADLHRLDAVAEELTTHAEVRYLGLSTGRYDLMIEAFFVSNEHMLDFISKKLGALEGVISVETSVILKVAKFSYEWEVP